MEKFNRPGPANETHSDLTRHTLKLDVGGQLIDPSSDELDFDDGGFCYIQIPDSFRWIADAHLDQEDFRDRVIYLTFHDGYQSDLGNDEIAGAVDEYLQKLEGVSEVYWEDRECFQITYKPGQDLTQLMLNIEQLMDLANETEN